MALGEHEYWIQEIVGDVTPDDFPLDGEAAGARSALLLGAAGEARRVRHVVQRLEGDGALACRASRRRSSPSGRSLNASL